MEVGQVYYNVIDRNSKTCLSSGPSIFTNIVRGYNATEFKKIGVQAPPGTQMVVNDKLTPIMIGATGIYELDEDISVTSLYFLRPKKFLKDVDESDAAINEGVKKMKEAEEERDKNIKVTIVNGKVTNLQVKVNNAMMSEPSRDSDDFMTFWNKYSEYQSDFISKYNEGLALYQTGSNGIYKLPNENDVNSEDNYEDLYNVIIDFIYN